MLFKKKKKETEKKRKLTLKRTIHNTFFVFKTVKAAAPGLLSVAILSVAFSSVTNFLGDSFMLRFIINSIESGREVSKILLYVGIIALMTLASNVGGNALWNFFHYRKYMDLSAYIERQLFKKSKDVELSCYEDPVFYDKYVKAMDEAPGKFESDLNNLVDMIWVVISMFANSFLLFWIDPVLIIFGLLPLFMGLLRKRFNELKHEYDGKIKTVNRKKKYVNRTFYLTEYAKEIRLTTIGGFLFGVHKETFEEYRALVREYGWRKGALKFGQNFGLQGLVILGAMLYSAYQTLNTGNMTIGDCLVVFNSISYVSWNLRSTVESLAEFQKNALYIEDYLKFMEYEPQIKGDGTTPPADATELRFENVSFKYSGSDAYILKDISFSLRPGEKIALVGQNGSGKSTLVKLMMRLYDPTEGKITLGGEDIKNFSPDLYRDVFGIVFQECRCFSLSVAENVLMRPLAPGDDEIVTEALRQSGAYEKIMSLKEGIHTVLTREFDDKGTVLSGGELQKVELARIFAIHTPFVILDEPSSALDPIAEYNMFENMTKACAGRSSVFISHRLSSATVADRVILIENGVIIEEGTHMELMRRDGKYAGMFRMQAENYLGDAANLTAAHIASAKPVTEGGAQ